MNMSDKLPMACPAVGEHRAKQSIMLPGQGVAFLEAVRTHIALCTIVVPGWMLIERYKTDVL